MEQLIMTGQLLLGLGLLVFIHELGHFMAARAFNIRVDKFFIFFDFGGYKLFSVHYGGTEYGMGWFPLGGYVKIAGMIDESVDKEFLNTEPQPWEFRSKPAWQRFIVMVGGITMNIILGVLIFAFYLKSYRISYIEPDKVPHGIYAYETGRELGFQHGDKIIAINHKPIKRGDDLKSMRVLFGAVLTLERNGQNIDIDLPDEIFRKLTSSKDFFISYDNYPFLVKAVVPGSIAEKSGLQAEDKILSVNNVPTVQYGKFRELLRENIGKEIQIGVERGGTLKQIAATASPDGTLGFISSPTEDSFLPLKKYSLLESFIFGTQEGFEAIYYNAVGIGKIFTGKVKATESVQSPIGIAKIYGGKWEWGKFWYITGLISFVLAFMNLLPIPALDGGHVVFIIIEVIQGKPVSEKVLEKAQVVGMVMLLALMIFAFGNDIYKIIGK